MQSLRSLIRSTAIGNGSLTVLVEDRIYPDELALVSNPIFPCVNFGLIGGSGADYDAPMVHYPNIQFWAWSTISKDQAHQIYEVVFNTFERQRLFSSDIRILYHEISGRSEIFDPLSKAYGVTARWGGIAVDRTNPF